MEGDGSSEDGTPVARLTAVAGPRKPIDAALLQTLMAAPAMFDKLVAESVTVLPVTGGQFWAAARFADQHSLGLRVGDALHLAAASEHGATVHMLDQRLAKAGPALRVPAQLLAMTSPGAPISILVPVSR